MMLDSEDIIQYLEMARIAMSHIPEDLEDQMDISDDEFIRLRDNLQKCLDAPVKARSAWDAQQPTWYL